MSVTPEMPSWFGYTPAALSRFEFRDLLVVDPGDDPAELLKQAESQLRQDETLYFVHPSFAVGKPPAAVLVKNVKSVTYDRHEFLGATYGKRWFAAVKRK
jgi:hypothetical protein